MSGGRLASGDLSSHVDIKLGGVGGVLLLRGVTDELFLRGVQLLHREDHGGRAAATAKCAPCHRSVRSHFTTTTTTSSIKVLVPPPPDFP